MISADLFLFRIINQVLSHPLADRFFIFITDEHSWIPVWVILFLLLMIRGGRKGRVTVLLMVIAFGITDFSAAQWIKPAAGRIRPSRLLREYQPLADSLSSVQARIDVSDSTRESLRSRESELCAVVRHYEDSLQITPEKKAALKDIRRLEGFGGRYSFPSNHAANFFALAFVFTFFYRKNRWIPWLLAALVAYSRVYVGRHYPLDVIAGAAYGALIAAMVCSAWQYLLYRRILHRNKNGASGDTPLS